jgi:hypothetical protein
VDRAERAVHELGIGAGASRLELEKVAVQRNDVLARLVDEVT